MLLIEEQQTHIWLIQSSFTINAYFFQSGKPWTEKNTNIEPAQTKADRDFVNSEHRWEQSQTRLKAVRDQGFNRGSKTSKTDFKIKQKLLFI